MGRSGSRLHGDRPDPECPRGAKPGGKKRGPSVRVPEACYPYERPMRVSRRLAFERMVWPRVAPVPFLFLVFGCGVSGSPPPSAPPGATAADATGVESGLPGDAASNGSPGSDAAAALDARPHGSPTDGSPTDGAVAIGQAEDATVAPDASDAGGSSDLNDGRSPVYTVQCGRALCGLDDGGTLLICCSTDLGVTGTCGSFSASCANPYPFYCGGPENCISTASCCAFGGGSSCLPIGDCPGANGSVICHDATDCAAGEGCCPMADASSFRICTAGPCR